MTEEEQPTPTQTRYHLVFGVGPYCARTEQRHVTHTRTASAFFARHPSPSEHGRTEVVEGGVVAAAAAAAPRIFSSYVTLCWSEDYNTDTGTRAGDRYVPRQQQ
jgi:hypothetical protein